MHQQMAQGRITARISLMRRLLLPWSALLAFTMVLHAQQPSNSNTHPSSNIDYPLALKARGIEGQVELEAIIAADGTIRKLRVIRGPAELRQPAINSILSWHYRPYLRDGIPTEVDTTIEVNFSLGKNKKERKKAIADAQAELAAQSTEPQPSTSAAPPTASSPKSPE